MCKQPTIATKAGGTHGYVRLLCNDPRGLLACGGRVPLSITVQRKRGLHTECYWLEQIEGGWRLWLDRDDREPQFHDLDTSFGGIPEEHWTCDCGQYTWRHRTQGACKHVRSVAALLRKIGLLENE